MAKQSNQDFTDEELMAFADGQCDAATAARIRVAAATNPAVGKRVEMFRAGAEAVRKAFPPKANAAADAKLEQMIRSATAKPSDPVSNVVQFPKPAKVQQSYWPRAAAAAVVLGIGLAGGYLLTTPGPGGQFQTAGNVSPAVQRLLESVPSGATGQADGQEYIFIASFKDGKGHVCREFEAGGSATGRSVTLACRDTAGWNTVLQAALPSTSTAFVPAGSNQAIEAYIAGSGLGEALSAEEEKHLLKP